MNFLLAPFLVSKLDWMMFIVLAVVSSVMMIFVGYKLLQMLQLSGYKLNGFFKWFKETKCSYLSRLFMLSFLSLASMLITNVLLADFFIEEILSYVSVLFYILFSSLFITNLFTAKQKTPLKYTKRMTRLVIVFFLLAGGFTWAMQYVGYKYVPYLRFGLIGITPVTLPVFVLLAYFITWPLEKLISSRYINKAKKKSLFMLDFEWALKDDIAKLVADNNMQNDVIFYIDDASADEIAEWNESLSFEPMII